MTIPESQEFPISQVVKTRYYKTFTVDGILKATQTKTFTTDSILKATQTKTFTVDAELYYISDIKIESSKTIKPEVVTTYY